MIVIPPRGGSLESLSAVALRGLIDERQQPDQAGDLKDPLYPLGPSDKDQTAALPPVGRPDHPQPAAVHELKLAQIDHDQPSISVPDALELSRDQLHRRKIKLSLEHHDIRITVAEAAYLQPAGWDGSILARRHDSNLHI